MSTGHELTPGMLLWRLLKSEPRSLQELKSSALFFPKCLGEAQSNMKFNQIHS